MLRTFERLPEPVRRYAVAALGAALALLLRYLLDPVLDTRYPYVVAWGAVTAVAWGAGFGPAVACTLVLAVVTDLWFVSPRGVLFRSAGPDLVAQAIFVVSGVCTAVLGGAERRARRRAARALAAAEDRRRELDRQRALLDTLFENAPAGLALFDADLRYVRVNAALAALNGHPPAAHVGRTPADMVPAVAADLAPVLRRVADTGEAVANVEIRGRPKSDPGREYVCLVSYFPVPGAAGERPGVGVVVADVTSAKRAEDDLRRSEDRYRAFVGQSSEGIWRFELDEPVPADLPPAEQVAAFFRHGFLAECNDACARMYGFNSAVELTGARLADFLDPADPRNVAYLTAFVRQGHRLAEAESRETDRNGHPRVFLNTLAGVIENGKVVRAWGTQRDVTDRTRAEEGLRASEERFRLATEAVRGLVYDADAATGRVERSAGMFDLIGVHPADADPRPEWWRARVDPGDYAAVVAAAEEAFARGAPTLQAEYRIRHADGRWVWVEDRSRVMYGADGKPRRSVGCTVDVTARKEADDRLRDSEARFRTLAETVPVAVWVCRPDGYTEYLNPRWEEMTGTPAAASVGTGWLDQLHPDDRPRAAAAWAVAVADPGRGYRIEFRLRTAGGGHRWVLAAGHPHRDAAGAVVRWFGTCTDIDAEKRQSETLERLVGERTAELRRSNRELEEFAYAASHDLQEPLRKIQAFGTRLRDKARDALDGENRDRLDRMMASAGRMGKLIDDLLEYSRVTTRGKTFAPVDLNAVLADALEDLAVRIEITGGAVTADPLPTVPGDASQMRQLFQNLIGNALKFHRPGVAPVVRVTAAPAAGGWELTVADEGIGFDARYAERIFQVFQRLHGRDEYEGSGIGLAVCQRIAARHGGTIAARGAPGAGAAFVVRLPG